MEPKHIIYLLVIALTLFAIFNLLMIHSLKQVAPEKTVKQAIKHLLIAGRSVEFYIGIICLAFALCVVLFLEGFKFI